MNEPIEFGDVLPKDLFDEIGEELFKKGWRLSNKSARMFATACQRIVQSIVKI